MRGTAANYVLMVLVFGLAGSAQAGTPVAVSPGGESYVVVINQECPTFSWSQVEGAVSYRVKVFETGHAEIIPYEIIEKLSEPVIGVEIKAPAFSWTPSGEDCLESGKRYVWYAGTAGISGEETWSMGKGFEIDMTASVGLREAVKDTVNNYLTKEWVGTETFKEVKEGIKTKVLNEIGGGNTGAGGVTSPERVARLGYEGSTNTFYGHYAGASTYGNWNTFIGIFTGYSNTTGDGDTFIGAYAGHSNTTASRNTFVGVTAGYSNTTGYHNTFVGDSAGSNNDGSANTFVGVTAGYSNTTGYYNTFLGERAGYSNTTSSGNTFVGDGAGYLNDGSANTFLGNSVGFFNTTGSYNTFLGNSAGYKSTTGNYNTFVGEAAGYLNTTGYHNTFLGGDAGFNNTTGYYNTILGPSAGVSNTTGSRNTLLGGYAGVWNKTGYGNVFLGYQAGYNETGSNKLYIANSDTTTPLIYGEFDSRKVRMNGSLMLNTDNIDAPSWAKLYGAASGDMAGFAFDSFGATSGLGGGAMFRFARGSQASKAAVQNGDRLGYLIFGGYDGANFLNTAALTAKVDGIVSGKNVPTKLVFETSASGYPRPERMVISSSGNVGIGTSTPSYPLHMGSGAYVSVGGVWTDASSREYKDNIQALTPEEAFDTLRELNPVKFTYNSDSTEKHVGFIAEEVPDLIATKGRKGLSPMDIVAVLTKVIQDQQKTISAHSEKIAELQRALQLKGTLAAVSDFPHDSLR